MTNQLNLDTLFDEHDVAKKINMSVATVRRRRLFNMPPKFLKLGTAVRYRPQDVQEWLESLPVGGNGGKR